MTSAEPTPESRGAAPADRQEDRGGATTEFFRGVGMLARGLAMWGRHPKLLLLGAVPAAITFLLLGSAVAVLAFWIDELATWITPFAGGWAAMWRLLTRILAGIAVMGVSLLLAVLLYTTITLAIGGPFYDKLSARVEWLVGDPPEEPDAPWWRSLAREVRDSLLVLVASAAVGILLLIAGFVPVLGQTVVPVAGACLGGWFITLEVVGIPYTRRGLRLADRRRALRRHRPLALGFGVSTFLLFLIPLGAVLVMPAAVAGGTLMARSFLDESGQ